MIDSAEEIDVNDKDLENLSEIKGSHMCPYVDNMVINMNMREWQSCKCHYYKDTQDNDMDIFYFMDDIL